MLTFAKISENQALEDEKIDLFGSGCGSGMELHAAGWIGSVGRDTNRSE
jgi:hypothetical protein